MSRGDAAMTGGSVACVVLAAGAGSRFAGTGHKLSATLPADASRPSETVARRSIAAALDAAIGPVLVVTGRLGVDDLGLTGPTALDPDHDRVIAVENVAWADGQITSVRAGIAAADRLGVDHVVIGLADQPGVTPEAWAAVASASVAGAAIAVATYDGRRGNPVALHRSVWELLPTTGDKGARALMSIRGDLVVPVPCTGHPADIDTVEDLRRWQNN